MDGTDGEPTFKMVGGALCLDFVNTVGNRLDPPSRRDHVASYADLLAWARQAGAITDDEARLLRREAEHRSDEAAAILARAVELREALYDVAAALAHGHPADPAGLETLNRFVGELLAPSRLVPAAAGYVLDRGDDPATLDRVLWPIVRSAVELLTSGDRVRRVRQCADDACAWVFVDASRGGRRRWCDMADCGNQAKVRRYRKRLAGAAA